MLRPEMARDVNFRERFRREAQNSSRLNHPNIVSVFDTGEKDVNGLTIPYIVMELVNGRTLRDIVREDGPLLRRKLHRFWRLSPTHCRPPTRRESSTAISLKQTSC